MPDLTLVLTAMAHGGLALGRDKSGRAVFVPFAIPGETVRVRVPRPGDRGRARRTAGRRQPSPDRVTPRCRHFGICGNCAFQHMGYAHNCGPRSGRRPRPVNRVGGIR
jgi:23S rRNA (uracil1939-C5)-methyltransferase